MRCVAWLNATLQQPAPQKSPGKRNPQSDVQQEPITRRQKHAADGVDFALPELGDEAYLLDIFFDVGPLVPGAMGDVPLLYGHLLDWQRAHGVALCPWEHGLLRRLSRAYCTALYTSTDPAAAAPGSVEETPEDAQERRQRVSDGLAQSLRMLRDTKPKR